MKILITGATGKIGRETALLFSKPENTIVLAYNTNLSLAKKLQKQILKLGGNAKIIKTDLTKNADIKKLFKITPDIIIHTAGTFPKGKWGNVCKRAYDDAMTQNLEATFFLLQEAVKKMKRGTIIILTDTCTNKFYKNFVPYCLAKAGIESLLKGIKHLLPKNLEVKTFSPYLTGKHKNMDKKVWNKLANKAVDSKQIAKQIIHIHRCQTPRHNTMK